MCIYTYSLVSTSSTSDIEASAVLKSKTWPAKSSTVTITSGLHTSWNLWIGYHTKDQPCSSSVEELRESLAVSLWGLTTMTLYSSTDDDLHLLHLTTMILHSTHDDDFLPPLTMSFQIPDFDSEEIRDI
jgi:hypothetical protein